MRQAPEHPMRTWAAAVTTGLSLVELHTPANTIVDINPAEVSSLREPLELSTQHWARGTHCVIVMSNGRTIAVTEDCPTVRHYLSQ
jgi:hypothetical protein